MTMCAGGLAKLIEECGELQQIAGKKLAYFHTDEHPDGGRSLRLRLQDELADADAAIHFVAKTMELDEEYIKARVKRKYDLFVKWHAMENNNLDAVDALPKVTNLPPTDYGERVHTSACETFQKHNPGFCNCRGVEWRGKPELVGRIEPIEDVHERINPK